MTDPFPAVARFHPMVRCACSTAAALSVALTACNKPVVHKAPPAPVARTGPPVEIVVEPYVVPGERKVLELRFFDLVVGRIEMRAGDPGTFENKRAIVIVSETRTDGAASVFVQLREQVATTLDLTDGLPIVSLGSFGGLISNRAQKPRARRWGRGGRYRLHNMHTAFAALRAWDPPPGTRGVLYGQVGWRRHRMTVTAAGRQVLSTAKGPVPAVRYEGEVGFINSSKGLRYVLWISDDRNRALVKLRTETQLGGTAELRLVSYSRPD